MDDILKPTPLLVTVRRMNSPFEKEPEESFIGFLVNEQGHYVESPSIGEHLFLAGDGSQSKEPWLFKSDRVFAMDCYDKEWVILTDQGLAYIIEHGRLLQ